MLDGIFAPVASGSRVCVSEKPDVVVNIALATFTTTSSMFYIFEQHRSPWHDSADCIFLLFLTPRKHAKSRTHESSLMIKSAIANVQ